VYEVIKWVNAYYEKSERDSAWIKDVKDFHRKFEIPIVATPKVPEISRKVLRKKLIVEEYEELLEALEADNLEEIADALVDLTYVGIGLGIEYGIPLDAVWAEIHRSNMRKLGGPKREDGKQLKPEGWRKPDIKAVLDRYR
jgi:predicted HAD superfamily Cof-like phosphohydrolase